MQNIEFPSVLSNPNKPGEGYVYTTKGSTIQVIQGQAQWFADNGRLYIAYAGQNPVEVMSNGQQQAYLNNLAANQAGYETTPGRNPTPPPAHPGYQTPGAYGQAPMGHPQAVGAPAHHAYPQHVGHPPMQTPQSGGFNGMHHPQAVNQNHMGHPQAVGHPPMGPTGPRPVGQAHMGHARHNPHKPVFDNRNNAPSNTSVSLGTVKPQPPVQVRRGTAPTDGYEINHATSLKEATKPMTPTTTPVQTEVPSNDILDALQVISKILNNEPYDTYSQDAMQIKDNPVYKSFCRDSAKTFLQLLEKPMNREEHKIFELADQPSDSVTLDAVREVDLSLREQRLQDVDVEPNSPAREIETVNSVIWLPELAGVFNSVPKLKFIKKEFHEDMAAISAAKLKAPVAVAADLRSLDRILTRFANMYIEIVCGSDLILDSLADEYPELTDMVDDQEDPCFTRTNFIEMREYLVGLISVDNSSGTKKIVKTYHSLQANLTLKDLQLDIPAQTTSIEKTECYFINRTTNPGFTGLLDDATIDPGACVIVELKDATVLAIRKTNTKWMLTTNIQSVQLVR